MLFLQPVVVNDAAQRPVAAEVRMAERQADQPEWTGLMLAQGPTDQRSPFGAGAPDKNDLRPPPTFVPPNPPADEPTPADTGKGPFTDPMDKKIPPPPARPDAGPPPPTGELVIPAGTVGALAQNTGTTTPGAAPTTTPTAAPSITMPGAAPTTTTPGAAPTTTTPGAAPTTTTPGALPSTTTPGLGGSSGTTTTPGMVPDTTVTGTGGTSGTTVTPGQVAPSGTTPGTTTYPGGVSTPAQPQSGVPAPGQSFPGLNSSSTFPGASSGASNTR